MDISEIEKACRELPDSAYSGRAVLLLCAEIRRLQALVTELADKAAIRLTGKPPKDGEKLD